MTESAPEFSAEEVKMIMSSFQELGLRPKADNPSSLLQWMSEVSKAKAEPNQTPQVAPSASLPTCTPVTLTRSPQLPYFSGDRKGDTDFDQWKHEYDCMSTRYSKDVLSEAVHRSLRGRAARVAMHVDKDATLEILVSKLDSVFGDIHTEHNIMARFYSAKQQEEECVSEWLCRLEDILSQGIQLGKVQASQREELLRTTVWTGLRPELRDLSSYKFDQGGPLDKFVRYLRQVEADLQQRKPDTKKKTHSATNMASVVKTESTELTEIRGILNSLSSEIAGLKKQNQDKREPQVVQTSTEPPRSSQGQGQPWMSSQEQPWQPPPRQWIPPQRSRGPPPPFQGNPSRFQGPPTSDIPVCYRCGQPGHIKKGCRARIQGDSAALNYNRSMGKDNPWA